MQHFQAPIKIGAQLQHVGAVSGVTQDGRGGAIDLPAGLASLKSSACCVKR
jgi:hypothetical protein